MQRILASLLIAAITLLALEGALTLLGRPPLLPRLWSSRDALTRPLSDDERRRAAAESPGILSFHADPRVGYVLRPCAELDMFDGHISSDELGLRKRAGPPEQPDALRIAVVGASIPFGLGVDDDETVAQRLETELAAARGPGQRQVVCRTVAMGRWNVGNAVAFLHDSMQELRPDLVLFMPYSNDLSDTDVVDESGHRRVYPDPVQADPWLSVRADDYGLLIDRVLGLRAEGLLGSSPLGPNVLVSDITPESSRRYDANAAAILRLRAELAARGARLAYVMFSENAHAWHMLERLLPAAPDLQVIPLLREFPPEFTLGFDPHPNATTHAVTGAWIARELLERGLVERGTGTLPEPGPPEYEERRAQPRTAAEIAALARQSRDGALAELQPVIDFTTGRGVGQVYGRVSTGLRAGPRVAVALRRAGSVLDIELAPLPECATLYPLDVGVEVDGVRLGVVTVKADGPTRARFGLPPGAGPALELKLIASDWIAGHFPGQDFQSLGAYKPVGFACSGG